MVCILERRTPITRPVARALETHASTAVPERRSAQAIPLMTLRRFLVKETGIDIPLMAHISKIAVRRRIGLSDYSNSENEIKDALGCSIWLQYSYHLIVILPNVRLLLRYVDGGNKEECSQSLKQRH